MALGALFMNTALAQTDPELDPVTITASLTPRKQSQTGRNLIIIKGEQFYNLPVHSIDDLLRYVPGVEVQMRGPAGAQSDIVLRGGTFQQVLVILDGVRLNDPNTGHFSSYIPIAPAEIDRIEILKGASSAVYGSEAVGGVIHIISKSFAARKERVRKEGVIQGTIGEYNLLKGSAGGFFGNKKSAVSGGLHTVHTKGAPQRGTRGFFDNTTASVSYSQSVRQWQFSARGAFDHRDFSAQNFYTTFVSDTASEKVQTVWSQAEIKRVTELSESRLDIGYKELDDIYAFNKASLPNRSKSRLWQALLQESRKLSSKTQLSAGAQIIRKEISSNDRGDHAVDQGALFLLLNQEAGDHLRFAPALRLEYNERSGLELIPQLNVSYQKGNLQLRGSAGKTIRDADFTERFNNYNKPFVASGRIGNPDLEAERSFSYEVGADLFSVKNFRISGTYFRRHHSKLIDYVLTPYANMPRKENLSPTGTYALARNVSKVRTQGAETDIQYQQKLGGGQNFWATVGMLWLNSKSSELTPSFYISSHARFLTNFNVRYSKNRFSIGFSGLYKNRQPQVVANPAIAKVSTDYFLLGGRTDVRILNHLYLFAQVDNFFNRQYTDLLGSAMPGRWTQGGFILNFTNHD